jgi:hypothetical protein
VVGPCGRGPAASRGSRRSRNIRYTTGTAILRRRHQHSLGRLAVTNAELENLGLDEFMGPRGPLSGAHVSPALGWAVGGHICRRPVEIPHVRPARFPHRQSHSVASVLAMGTWRMKEL